MSLSRKYKSIVSIIEETRDLKTLRSEEVIASIKVFDRREDMHDERERFVNTERAFSSLRIGGNNYSHNNKGSPGRSHPKWQNQQRKLANWSQSGSLPNLQNAN